MAKYSKKKRMKVFLCHAHSDRGAVVKLYSWLVHSGVDAWLDKEKLLPGQDWELEIRRAVRDADVVVVCLSSQFNQAGFRQKEVRLALDTAMEKPEGEIFVIPARLDECDTPESLRKWHWVDLFDEHGYEVLLRALKLRAEKIGAIAQQESSQKLRGAPPPTHESASPDKEIHGYKSKIQLPIEHLIGILDRFERGDLDGYSSNEISSVLEDLESFQRIYGSDVELGTLCDMASRIISHLFVARGHASDAIPRNIDYYNNILEVRRLIQLIKHIR